MAGTNASIKALRALLRAEGYTMEEFSAAIRLHKSRNDRLMAVVGGSDLERSFAELLRFAMPNGYGTLFDPRGALSTFSAKVELAYALGLVDQDIQRNGNYVREIRNVFAHRVQHTTFHMPEVSAVCRLLTLGPSEERPRAKTNMRLRFHYAVVATGLAMASVYYGSAEPPASLLER